MAVQLLKQPPLTREVAEIFVGLRREVGAVTRACWERARRHPPARSSRWSNHAWHADPRSMKPTPVASLGQVFAEAWILPDDIGMRRGAAL